MSFDQFMLCTFAVENFLRHSRQLPELTIRLLFVLLLFLLFPLFHFASRSTLNACVFFFLPFATSTVAHFGYFYFLVLFPFHKFIGFSEHCLPPFLSIGSEFASRQQGFFYSKYRFAAVSALREKQLAAQINKKMNALAKSK